MPLQKDIHAIFYIFLTENGTIKTGVNLSYKNDFDDDVIIQKWFFHKFEVDLNCDENRVLDIEKDSSSIGIGIMPFREDLEQPRIKIEKLKLSFTENK